MTLTFTRIAHFKEIRVGCFEALDWIHAVAFVHERGLSSEKLDGVPIRVDGGLPLRTFMLVPASGEVEIYSIPSSR